MSRPDYHSLWAPHSSLPLQPLESPVERAVPFVMGGSVALSGAPPREQKADCSIGG